MVNLPREASLRGTERSRGQESEREYMSFYAPWLAVMLFGAILFLVGLYLMRSERKRKP